MAYPLMRHMHAQVCTSSPIYYLEQSFNNQSIATLSTITDSTRGWPLLGLGTLPTAGERKQVGVLKDTEASQSVYARMCMF